MFDTSAYFERIGYRGDSSASLATLTAIVEHHASAIPFENLDPLLRVPVALDAESLQRKLVQNGRGGFCFEHNTLLQLALRALGFDVTPLGARVIWAAAPEHIGARTHMLLRVNLPDDPRLVDVGFGGLTLTGALLIEPGVAQPTPHERCRLTSWPEGNGLVMESELGAGGGASAGVWKPLYRFDQVQQYATDYELACWYLCNHPSSHMVNTLMAARAAPGVRYALSNRTLTSYRVGQAPEQRLLTSAAELRACLHDVFTIRLPEHPALAPLLERLVSADDGK